MHHHILRSFLWTQWADRETLVSLAKANDPPNKAVRIMAHIIGAQRLWYDRVKGEASATPVWPDWTIARQTRASEEIHELWARYLGGLNGAELDRRVEYATSAGEKYSSTVAEILEHVVMHSAYHRGQVASELRNAGFGPVLTDYIHAARTGKI